MDVIILKRISRMLLRLPVFGNILVNVIQIKSVSGLLQRRSRKSVLRNVEFQLVDHCNLNCKYCNHFSPIADEIFADFGVFERDVSRMSELFGDSVLHIALAGGEPLLHKDVCLFMECTRKYFPSASISLITNGILLKTVPESFWNALTENNVLLEVTQYPIHINWDYISATAEKYGCKVQYSVPRKDGMQRLPIDPKGSQDRVKNYYCQCYMGGFCVSIQNGRLYPCPIAQNIQYLIKKFELNIDVGESNYLDIYQIKSRDEIFDFLSKPVPCCGYCKWDVISYHNAWSRTDGCDVSEWVDDD